MRLAAWISPSEGLTAPFHAPRAAKRNKCQGLIDLGAFKSHLVNSVFTPYLHGD
jgi:hypothetical protein